MPGRRAQARDRLLHWRGVVAAAQVADVQCPAAADRFEAPQRGEQDSRSATVCSSRSAAAMTTPISDTSVKPASPRVQLRAARQLVRCARPTVPALTRPRPPAPVAC